MAGKRKGPVRVGVVGLGYWGPNLVRTISQVGGAKVTMVCDVDAKRRREITKVYEGVAATESFADMLASEVEAVVIATPFLTHYQLAGQALAAGKHILVEKPFVQTAAEARKLGRLASKKALTLMVDHTFEYSAAVQKMRQLVQKGEVGSVYSVEMRRMNLGLFQRDHNVVWDLAYHDVAILQYVFDDLPISVVGVGGAHVQKGIEDSAYVVLKFSQGMQAVVHLSWLYPEKVRQITVVGSKKMLMYDDLQATEKLKIVDKGVAVSSKGLPKMSHYTSMAEFSYLYRHGDVSIPRLEQIEPLVAVAGEFVASVRTGKAPRSGVQAAEGVVRVVGAIDKSVKSGGREVRVKR